MGVAAMKKVIAKRWLNVEGNWHKPGEAFEVETLAGIPADAVEAVAEEPEAEAVQPERPEKVEKKAEEPKQETTRRRNTRK